MTLGKMGTFWPDSSISTAVGNDPLREKGDREKEGKAFYKCVPEK